MTPGFKGFIQGLTWALLFVGACLLLLFLSGCATADNGVQMNEQEAAACKAEGCAVYTELELRSLVGRAIEAGYRKGWGDAIQQGAKDL